MEIICFFAGIHHHGNDGKYKDGVQKGADKFFSYVPIKFLAAIMRGWDLVSISNRCAKIKVLAWKAVFCLVMVL
jgi:hypothetical protein